MLFACYCPSQFAKSPELDAMKRPSDQVSQSKTMQAALHVADSPLLKIVDDYPIPSPGPTEVLLKIEASGACHSDVLFLSQVPVDKRTYAMGHEAAGIAHELGSKVNKVKKDSRYAILGFGGCIQCLAMANGLTRASEPEDEFFGIPFFGLGGDGGHAEYAAVDQDLLVPVPDGVKPEHAAVMADAGVTAWHAIKTTSQIKDGEKVIITGIGGLGLLAVQFADHLGAEVYAIDTRLSSRKLALKFGAKKAFDLAELDAELAKGFTVDCAVDFVSTDTTFTREVNAVSRVGFNTNLKKSGRITIVGVSDQNLVLNVLSSIVDEITLRFSLYGVKEDLEEVLQLVAEGIVTPVVESLPLKEANRAYNDLRANLALSRKVLIPPSFWKGRHENEIEGAV